MKEVEKKNLAIPYIPELDNLGDADEIINLLDSRGERRSISSLNWGEKYPYKPLAAFATAHSDMALYVDFFVRCNYLRAENYRNQSPVSQDSCVEVFLQPAEDGPYWNFEFNCIGAINASTRTERPNPRRLSDMELSLVRRYPSCGTRPFRELQGLFSWNLLVAIPFELLGIRYEGKPLKIRGNFYKCSSGASIPHYMSWSPIATPDPDFHRPEFFGDLLLE